MWLYNVARVLLTIPIKLIYPTKVYDKKQLPEGRCVVCCNHLSVMDVLILALSYKRNLTLLHKEELSGNFFTKWLFKSLGAVAIARGANDFSAMRKILATLNEDKAIALFPEGTRNKTAPGKLLPFKTGVAMFAMKTGADCYPVVLLEKPKAFRKNYMLMGEVVKVEKHAGRLTSEDLDNFTVKLQSQMERELEQLKTRISNKKVSKEMQD